MKVKADITEFCNYDGLCQLSIENRKRGHDFCYGEKYGERCCPLKSKYAEFSIKEDKLYLYDEKNKKFM